MSNDVSTAWSANIWMQPFQPFIYYGSPMPQQVEVKRTKQLTITANLKDFEVAYTDSHANVKRGNYSQKELLEALPDLLAKLTKEPKETD